MPQTKSDIFWQNGLGRSEIAGPSSMRGWITRGSAPWCTDSSVVYPTRYGYAQSPSQAIVSASNRSMRGDIVMHVGLNFIGGDQRAWEFGSIMRVEGSSMIEPPVVECFRETLLAEDELLVDLMVDPDLYSAVADDLEDLMARRSSRSPQTDEEWADAMLRDTIGD